MRNFCGRKRRPIGERQQIQVAHLADVEAALRRLQRLVQLPEQLLGLAAQNRDVQTVEGLGHRVGHGPDDEHAAAGRRVAQRCSIAWRSSGSVISEGLKTYKSAPPGTRSSEYSTSCPKRVKDGRQVGVHQGHRSMIALEKAAHDQPRNSAVARDIGRRQNRRRNPWRHPAFAYPTGRRASDTPCQGQAWKRRLSGGPPRGAARSGIHRAG